MFGENRKLLHFLLNFLEILRFLYVNDLEGGMSENKALGGDHAKLHAKKQGLKSMTSMAIL